MDIVPGMKVKVHYNLHKGGYSVTVAGKVVANVPEIALRDVRFTVQPAGLAKVRETQRRKVCAYATGIVAEVPSVKPPRKVTFNPKRLDHDTFTCEGVPVHDAGFVVFSGAYGWV